MPKQYITFGDLKQAIASIAGVLDTDEIHYIEIRHPPKLLADLRSRFVIIREADGSISIQDTIAVP